MSSPSARPDPDALLRDVQAEEARAKRGKLKIFFGFAPGVGKTYRMLQVARDLVLEQHLDVVVGLVETHRRAETAAMTLGLEILPRREVEYRGKRIEEFDLDAALARRPALLLLDELAHTNAPGSRHAKRWQDVLELVDAGIDVYTTVNVQHVESLNDIIAQITHVQVRETIPDSLLDRADELELIDIAPEELLQRLREGKVYLTEQAQRAAEHFFKRGNLLALRELALRRTAQQVDDDVQQYRLSHGVTATWPVGERILVCVGPSPSSARLIRAAARMASGLRCTWGALYVDPGSLAGAERVRENVEAHARLVESLGGKFTRVAARRVGEAILAFARRSNVTRLIVGKPTHSRWRDRWRGSLLDSIVRGSGDIEVHVIAGDEATDAAHLPSAEPVPVAEVASYAGAAALVAVTTAIAIGLKQWLDLPDLEMLYFVAIIVAAIRLGRGPAIVCAALGVAAYDFWFVEPFLTFAVADARYILTFAMMFAVGYVVSELTTSLRRQEQEAITREQRTAALYALSRDLGNAHDKRGVAMVVARHATEAFAGAAYVYAPLAQDGIELIGATPGAPMPQAKEVGVAKWAFENDAPAGVGTDTLPGAGVLCAPLTAGEGVLGVLALAELPDRGMHSEQRAFLDAFRTQAAFALERVRLSEEARRAALRAETEEMRSSLLATVSHDLRTPLAAITGAATSLRDDVHASPDTRRELVEAICEQAEHLERLVGNLLDLTRLEAGNLVLKPDWVPLEEVVGSALNRLEGRLAARPVVIDLASDLPLLSLDPVLFEQVVVNLVDNAIKYAKGDAPIELRAKVEASLVVFEVMDRGPGLPEGSEERVFEKFYRGSHAGVAGVGLGLPICRAIVQLHGGTIRAENRSGGGAVFRIVLPLQGTPPSLAPEVGA